MRRRFADVVTELSWASEQKPISESLALAQESIGDIGSLSADAAMGVALSIITAKAAA